MTELKTQRRIAEPLIGLLFICAAVFFEIWNYQNPGLGRPELRPVFHFAVALIALRGLARLFGWRLGIKPKDGDS
jgi:hypothetical protein